MKIMLEHQTMDSNTTQIHYHRTSPGGKPPMVFIHGFTDNGLCWYPIAEELKEHYDIILPDMAGHGLSSRYIQGQQIDMAQNVADLICSLNLDRPIVCGHSMGAMVSFELGLRFPALVKALILEDPPWQPITRKEQLPDLPREEPPVITWAKSLAERTYDELLAECRRDNPSWPDELRQFMCQSKKQLDQRIIEPLAEKLHKNGIRWLDELKDITMPLLLITGDRDRGAFVSQEMAQEAQRTNPLVKTAHIPGTGHLIRYDNQKSFMTYLSEFLNNLP